METKYYKVIIAGSRSFCDYSILRDCCDEILSETCKIAIVSGTAKGTDMLGERYATEKAYPILRFPADWKKFGRAAGIIRNAEMARHANALIAFWDGKSTGTKNMIDTARKNGLKVSIIQI